MSIKELFNHPNFVDLMDQKLEEVVKENPNFIYSIGSRACYYNKGTSFAECDGCIIGQAFQKLGISKESLDLLNNIGSISLVISNFKSDLSFKKYNWIVLQNDQDNGKTWEQALKESKI